MDQEQQGAGPLIGIIIIVLILVLGGIYYAGKTEPNPEVEITAEEILNEPDPLIENLNTVGTADDIASIEADLESTDINSLDAELDAIDAELGNI